MGPRAFGGPDGVDPLEIIKRNFLYYLEGKLDEAPILIEFLRAPSVSVIPVSKSMYFR